MDTGIREADLSGRQLGAYQLERLIGAGAFGSVYLGRHVHLGVLRAVKVLQAGLAVVPELQARFLQEARTAASLSHPCIVPVYDFGIDAGVQYLVMDYVESVTLAQHLEPLEPGRRLADSAVLAAVRDVASALDYAHDRAVVHRDLKPANVLVRGGEQRALLTDFGVAKVLSESGRTQTGLTIGSYAYMSPEQCSGVVSGLTARSDVYAFAAVLYEIASGSPPFGRGVAAVGGHLHQPPPSVGPAQPSLAAALDPILRRGLAKRPGDRPETAGELAAAFLEAVTEPTVVRSAQPVAAAAERRPQGSRPVARIAAVTAAVLTLAGGGAGAVAVAQGWPGIVLQRDAPNPGPSTFPTDFPIDHPGHAARGMVGSPVEVTDQNGMHAQVTVVSDNLDDQGSARVPLYDKLAYRYVDVRVKLKNLAPDGLDYSAADVWLSDSTGHPYPSQQSPMGSSIPEAAGSLPQGQSVDGSVAFEVPRSASGLEVWVIVGFKAIRVPLH